MTTPTLAESVRYLAERHAGTGPQLWQCPSCGTEVVALCHECGHRCPSARHAWRAFVRVEEAK